MLFRVLVCLAISCSFPALSKESGPREPKDKTESPSGQEKRGENTYYNTQPFFTTGRPIFSPTIQIYTKQSGGEESQCPSPKDWKEWGSFAWCQTVEWIDAERIIAIFTVILGIATWRLWIATDRLVNDARETARLQLRAYVFPSACDLFEGMMLDPPRTDQTHVPGVIMQIKNFGNTPAKNLVSNMRIFVGDIECSNTVKIVELLQISPITLAAGNAFPKYMWYERPLTYDEIALIGAGKKGIFVYGRIEYDDIFGEKRYTNFSLVYTNSKFPPVPPSGGFMHSYDGNESN
jgi:hypothetical protein